MRGLALLLAVVALGCSGTPAAASGQWVKLFDGATGTQAITQFGFQAGTWDAGRSRMYILDPSQTVSRVWEWRQVRHEAGNGRRT